MEQQTATIEAQRNDRKAEVGNCPAITASIINPHGEFPTEAFHEAQEVIANMDLDIPNKSAKTVAEVVYDKSSESDSYEINTL